MKRIKQVHCEDIDLGQDIVKESEVSEEGQLKAATEELQLNKD